MMAWPTVRYPIVGRAPVHARVTVVGMEGEGRTTTRDRHTTLRSCTVGCIGVVGPDLTAFLAGAESPDQLAEWADTDAEPAATARLLAVRQVVEIFATVNRVSLVGPWLTDARAVEGRTSPAEMIRACGDDESLKKIYDAATEFAH